MPGNSFGFAPGFACEVGVLWGFSKFGRSKKSIPSNLGGLKSPSPPSCRRCARSPFENTKKMPPFARHLLHDSTASLQSRRFQRSHHVEQLGDWHLWLLRRQGLRHRLLLQALLRAARASNRPIAAKKLSSRNQHSSPLPAPSFTLCSAPRSRLVRVLPRAAGLSMPLGRRHGEGRPRQLLWLLLGPLLLHSLRYLPGASEEKE